MELGDLVMLFTDGLFEVENPDGELFTQEMVQAAFQKRMHLPISELFDDILAEINRFSGGQEFQDDVCIVGVEVADVA
jgi:serine phosphatase RsbU (regulator of sigma subunit)